MGLNTGAVGAGRATTRVDWGSKGIDGENGGGLGGTGKGMGVRAWVSSQVITFDEKCQPNATEPAGGKSGYGVTG